MLSPQQYQLSQIRMAANGNGKRPAGDAGVSLEGNTSPPAKREVQLKKCCFTLNNPSHEDRKEFWVLDQDERVARLIYQVRTLLELLETRF